VLLITHQPHSVGVREGHLAGLPGGLNHADAVGTRVRDNAGNEPAQKYGEPCSGEHVQRDKNNV
jgi:hypothetical protein